VGVHPRNEPCRVVLSGSRTGSAPLANTGSVLNPPKPPSVVTVPPDTVPSVPRVASFVPADAYVTLVVDPHQRLVSGVHPSGGCREPPAEKRRPRPYSARTSTGACLLACLLAALWVRYDHAASITGGAVRRTRLTDRARGGMTGATHLLRVLADSAQRILPGCLGRRAVAPERSATRLSRRPRCREFTPVPKPRRPWRQRPRRSRTGVHATTGLSRFARRSLSPSRESPHSLRSVRRAREQPA
jgi:hypothetical protein